ncbi:MAG: anti-sigma factor, partial [Planctomycetota bacterium]
ESTAAAAQIAMRVTHDDLPQDLSQSIRQRGIDMVQERCLDSTASAWVGDRALSNGVKADNPAKAVALAPKSKAAVSSGREWFAWVVAIAATLLAIVLWQGGDTSVEQDAPISLVDRRSDLLSKTGITQVSWSPGKTELANEVTGDVVWDPSSQTGFMTFNGLPINDPTVEQYQLWIIDPERDDEPVDGGVFDITSAGESVVAINAKLNVIQPAAFAITIEKPGGVVVSTQERLPLLASVE